MRHRIAIAIALFALLAAGCTTEYSPCCQKKYALDEFTGESLVSGGRCVLQNDTDLSSFAMRTECNDTTGSLWSNACNVTFNIAAPGGNNSTIIPICADDVPRICVQEGCKGMICGKFANNARPVATQKDVQNSQYDSSANNQVVGLYNAQCSFETMSRRTYNTIKRAKGNLWVNSFRFGVGNSLEEFEEYRLFFPISDWFCSANPMGTVDRYMNYVNYRAGLPTERCKYYASLPVWLCDGSQEYNYTTSASCTNSCLGTCSAAFLPGYKCPALDLGFGNPNQCEAYCPRYDADVCPNQANVNAGKFPFLNSSVEYRVMTTEYWAETECGYKHKPCWWWYYIDDATGLGGINPDNSPNLGPLFTTREIDSEGYKKILWAQYGASVWQGHLNASGQRISGAAFECQSSIECLSGYCNTDNYRRSACISTADPLTEIDCSCYVDTKGDNKKHCTGNTTSATGIYNMFGLDFEDDYLTNIRLGFPRRGELLIEDTSSSTVHVVPDNPYAAWNPTPGAGYNPIRIPLIDNCSVPSSAYAITDFDGGRPWYGDGWPSVIWNDNPGGLNRIYVYYLRITDTAWTGSCVPATSGGYGPELRVHGWCEPCTYATLARGHNANTYTGGYCPAFKWLRGENASMDAIEGYGAVGMTVDCGYCDTWNCYRGRNCYGMGQYGGYGCVKSWPTSTASFPNAVNMEEKYAKAGVMLVNWGYGALGDLNVKYYNSVTRRLCGSTDASPHSDHLPFDINSIGAGQHACLAVPEDYNVFSMTLTNVPSAQIAAIADATELTSDPAPLIRFCFNPYCSPAFSWDGDGMTDCSVMPCTPLTDPATGMGYYKKNTSGIFPLMGKPMTKIEYYRKVVYGANAQCDKCIVGVAATEGQMPELREFFQPHIINPFMPSVNNAQADGAEIILTSWTFGQTGSCNPEDEFEAMVAFGRSLLVEFGKPSIIWDWKLGSCPLAQKKEMVRLVFEKQRELSSAGVIGVIYTDTPSLAARNEEFCAVQNSSKNVLGIRNSTLYMKVTGRDAPCYCEKCTDFEMATCTAAVGGEMRMTASGAECTKPQNVDAALWLSIKSQYKTPANCFEAGSCVMCESKTTLPADRVSCIRQTANGKASGVFDIADLNDSYREIIASLPPSKRCCLNATDPQNNSINYTYTKISGQRQNFELDIFPARGEEGIDCGKTPDTSPQACGIVIPVVEESVTCR